MNVLNLKISIAWFLLGIIILPLLGFIARSVQLKKKRRRIEELETEIVNSHADILSLQAQLVTLNNHDAKSEPAKENGSLIENVGNAKLKVNGI